MPEASTTSVAADRYDELCGRLSGVARIDESRAVTESFLPEASRISARNAAISSFYAAAYLDQPELFKWAGMAAFASNHAKSLLLPLRIGTRPQGIQAWARWLLRDFETVRTINNEIFRDIFWAHAVYRGTPEGLARLCEIVGDDDGPAGAIRSAFGEIERGRKEVAAGGRGPGVNGSGAVTSACSGTNRSTWSSSPIRVLQLRLRPRFLDRIIAGFRGSRLVRAHALLHQLLLAYLASAS